MLVLVDKEVRKVRELVEKYYDMELNFWMILMLFFVIMGCVFFFLLCLIIYV